jgi:hypothetical protein
MKADVGARSRNQQRNSFATPIAGLVGYGTVHKNLVFCDGTNWKFVKGTTATSCASYPGSGVSERVIEWHADGSGKTYVSSPAIRTTPREGSMIYNSSLSFPQVCNCTNWVTLSSSTPNTFLLTDQTGVTLSTLISSNILLIEGLNQSTTVTLSGSGGSPEFRICADISCSSVVTNWGTSSTSISNGQYVQLRLTSSATSSVSVTATLNIGGVSDIWSVTTGDFAPNTFDFTDNTNVNLSTLTNSNVVQIVGIDLAVPVSVSGDGSPEFRVCSNLSCSAVITNWGSAASTVSNGNYVQLRLTSSANSSTANTATLNVGVGSANWAVTTDDFLPDSFDFTNVTNSPMATLITSNIIQITGLTTSSLSTISVSGSDGTPQFRVCSNSDCSSVTRTWSVDPYSATTHNTKYVQVRLTSGSIYAQNYVAVVTIGEGTDSWTVSTPAVPGGFLVLSETTYNGNLGGLTGADALCYTDVTTYDWRGKSQAGTITAGRVKAFLCSTTTCNNLTASTTYGYAKSNYTSVGGKVFTSDASGLGPGSADDWSANTHFGLYGTYWTGRAPGGSTTTWPNTVASGTSNNSFCTNWTSTSSGRGGVLGSPNTTNADRWSYGTTATCDLSLKLVCIVNP